MHLNQYLIESRQSQEDFGKRLNPPVSQGLVSQWIRGVTRITLLQALQIKKLTRNKVTPQDCADMYTGPARRERPSASAHPQ